MARTVWNIIVYTFALIGFFLLAGFFSVKYGLTNTAGIIDTQRDVFLANAVSSASTTPAYYWQNQHEWQILRVAIQKDAPTIQRASATTGVPSRLIVACLVAEQLRLFYSERQAFKAWFEPLKILGNETQFSLGVMGVKDETGQAIEQNLQSSTSPYYLGPSFAHLLDFSTADTSQERFARLTDPHDHYWSYLYSGIFIRQIELQWQRAGFDISKKPEIVSTLFNIGFIHSKPKANPYSGGAEIQIGDHVYSFGTLAGEFYYSDELLAEFPR